MKIVELVISILIPIILGLIFKFIGVFKESESDAIVKFVVKVSFLFIIFRNLYNAQFDSLGQIIPLTFSSIMVTVFYFALSLVFFRLIKTGKSQKGTVSFATLFGNYGYLGWGMIFYFYGEEGLTRAIFFVVFFLLIFFISGFMFIYTVEHHGFSKKLLLTTLAKNAFAPLGVAILGLVFKILKLSIHPIIYGAVNDFANLGIPLILFTIGLNMSFKLDLHRFKLIFISSFSRLIVGFLFGFVTAFVTALLFKTDLLSQKVIILETVMPTAAMTLFFTEYIDSDKELMSVIITFSTILSLITVPLWYIVIEFIM